MIHLAYLSPSNFAEQILFSTSPCTAVVPREIENNASAEFLTVKEVFHGQCEMGELKFAFLKANLVSRVSLLFVQKSGESLITRMALGKILVKYTVTGIHRRYND